MIYGTLADGGRKSKGGQKGKKKNHEKKKAYIHTAVLVKEVEYTFLESSETSETFE